MGSHTTYFCDRCNQDRDASWDGGASSVTYSEYPAGDGWAEFKVPYTDSGGYSSTYEVNVCAHCLADPNFTPKPNWQIADWDNDSRERVENGRRLAEAFAWAEEALGTPGRWGRREGVRQVFHDRDGAPYGHCVGPKLDDGSWSTQFADWEYERAARDQVRVDALFAAAA